MSHCIDSPETPAIMRTLEDTRIMPAPDFEQFCSTLRRKGNPNRVPFFELFVNPKIMDEILGKKTTDRLSTLEFYYKAGYDYIPAWPTVNWIFGSLVDTTSDYPIKDWATFEKYSWPTSDTICYKEFEQVIPHLPDGMKMIGQTGGVFEAAQHLLGFTGLCYMLVDNPDLVASVFSKIEEVYIAIYCGMASIEHVGALNISDDMGYKTQTLIGVNELRKYVLPVHKKLAKIIHAVGKPCILHSCGYLEEIMEDIITDVGIDAKHSYEDSIVPVEEMKRRYGNRIAILGGFDMDRLCRSTPEQVREHTRKLTTELGSDGGYALGSGNSIAAYVPVENYLTMLDEGWTLRH